MTPEPAAPHRGLPGARGAIRPMTISSPTPTHTATRDRYYDPNRRPTGAERPRTEEPAPLDAYYDFDLPDRMRALMKSLAEHPAMRPLLMARELSYRPRPSDARLAVGCARCNETPCQCGDLSARANDLMAVAYRDAKLRPLFDSQRLVVLQ